jgi:hypothetical protein
LGRFNVAVALAQAKRFDDARAYAEAAFANFRRLGDGAVEYVHSVERLMTTIGEAKVEV